MRKTVMALGLLLGAMTVRADAPVLPAALTWAYPAATDKSPFPEMPAEQIFTVTGSKISLTGQQVNESQDAIDWLPDSHPPAPAVVVHFDQDRKIEACAGCHLMTGQGLLEVPSLAGLPAAYIVEQIHEFQSGRRHSADPNRAEAAHMARIAKALPDAEAKSVAEYFAAIKRRPSRIQVIETKTPPAIRANSNGWQELVPGGKSEPIGHRILEVSANFNQMWIGDQTIDTLVYAPPGAIGRGKALAHSCVACHGADLKGTGKIPPLAGRDPHYLARALWDIKSGARNGPTVALMQKPVAALKEEEIGDLVVYLASLAP